MSTPDARVVVEQHRHDVAVRAHQRARRRVLAHERERLVEPGTLGERLDRLDRAGRARRRSARRSPCSARTGSTARGRTSRRRSRSTSSAGLAMTATRERAQPVVVDARCRGRRPWRGGSGRWSRRSVRVHERRHLASEAAHELAVGFVGEQCRGIGRRDPTALVDLVVRRPAGLATVTVICQNRTCLWRPCRST